MSTYRTQIGAAGAYYGLSDTATNWPANCGGSNNPHAFMAGFVGSYLQSGVSTLKRRAVCVYSSSSAATFAARLTAAGRQCPARIGPQPATIPILSPARPY